MHSFSVHNSGKMMQEGEFIGDASNAEDVLKLTCEKCGSLVAFWKRVKPVVSEHEFNIICTHRIEEEIETEFFYASISTNFCRHCTKDKPISEIVKRLEIEERIDVTLHDDGNDGYIVSLYVEIDISNRDILDTMLFIQKSLTK